MVKVRQEKAQRTAALMSLMAAAAAALLILVGRLAWPSNDNTMAHQRDIRDMTVTWECPSGKRFEARGQCSPLPCPGEKGTADIVLEGTCRDHGRFTVHARYALDADGRAVLAKIRKDQGTWQPVRDRIRCPTCDRPARTVSPR